MGHPGDGLNMGKGKCAVSPLRYAYSRVASVEMTFHIWRIK
jgi:hypothetical protein